MSTEILKFKNLHVYGRPFMGLWQPLFCLLVGISVGGTSYGQSICESVSIPGFVEVKVGGDDERTGKQNYFPPAGCTIKSFTLSKDGSYGDTEFSVESVNPDAAVVSWRAKSHWQIIDTKTAYLNLKAAVQLESKSPNTPTPDSSTPSDNITQLPDNKGAVSGNNAPFSPSPLSIFALVIVAGMTTFLGFQALKIAQGSTSPNSLYFTAAISIILAFIIGLLFPGSVIWEGFGVTFTTSGVAPTLAALISLVFILWSRNSLPGTPASVPPAPPASPEK